jgi:ribulose-bisphosphate carboxylase large chain
METGSVVSLISVISAAVTSTGARIDDIRIPPVLLRTFAGPAQGLQGVRDASNKYGRPLLSATLRPVLGLSPKMYGRAAFEALSGGIDMTCDPTLLHTIPSNDWRERFRYIADALDMARSQTGEGKVHAVNVSAPTVEDMLDRATEAAALKIGAVLVDSGAVGWSALQSLAHYCTKNDLVLCAMGGRVLNNGPLSQQLVAKLLRFTGCDVVSVGSPLRGNANARRNIKGIVAALRGEDYSATPEGHVMYDQPTCGIRTALPACGGGHNAWHLPQLIDALGDDTILQCGGSTMGHPWGSQSGAVANRTAVEALIKARNEGRNLALDGRAILHDAAGHCGELKEALNHWREGSFLFGVISGTDVDNLGAVIIRDQLGNKPAKRPAKSEAMLKDLTTGRTIRRHKDTTPEEDK